jgi:hypothetical protein
MQLSGIAQGEAESIPAGVRSGAAAAAAVVVRAAVVVVEDSDEPGVALVALETNAVGVVVGVVVDPALRSKMRASRCRCRLRYRNRISGRHDPAWPSWPSVLRDRLELESNPHRARRRASRRLQVV